jgi:hypothetical protein
MSMFITGTLRVKADVTRPFKTEEVLDKRFRFCEGVRYRFVVVIL